jgi:hypothetical protein
MLLNEAVLSANVIVVHPGNALNRSFVQGVRTNLDG